MNKFLAIFRAENLINWIKNIFSRFPSSMIISLIITCISIYVIAIGSDLDSEILKNLIRINLSLVLTFFVSVWLYIFWESLGFSKLKNQYLQIFSLLFWFLFFLFFDSNLDSFRNIIFFAINIICIISFIFFAPYIKKLFNKKNENTKQEQENYYSYFSSMLWNIFSAALVGFSIFFLSSIWFLTIEHLFDLNLNGKIYWYVASLSFALITPAFWLNSIWKKDSFENARYNENPFWLFLIKYIAIPFIFIYFVILYAYPIKVFFISGWPKWVISWLVIIFSSFWYLFYILSYIYEEKNYMIKKFRKYFPIIVFPQIFMLFYAIFLRINQYNLTVNRYLVLIFGIWLLFITIYFIFSKRKYLAFIVVSLFVFSSLASIWPWWIYSLPETLQYNSLKSELKNIWILKENWEIVPLNEEQKENTSKKLQSSISSKIDYLCNWHNSCPKLAREITKNNIDLLKLDYYEWKDFEDVSHWSLKRWIKSYLNLDSSRYIEEIWERINFYWEEKFLNIKWYDILNNFRDTERSGSIYDLWVDNYYSKINILNEKIIIYKGENIFEEINVKNILDDIIKNHKNLFGDENKSKSSISYEIETKKVKIKIILENINLTILNWKINFENWYNNLSWYVLYFIK